MPWEEKTVEQTRQTFIDLAGQPERNFSALCQAYGISRKTGYKWLNRFAQGQSLKNQSKRPFHSPAQTPAQTQERILELRDEHPAWGPRKLKRVLENRGEVMPSKSTIGAILRRNGRISPQESAKHKPCQRFEREHPNQLWQTDFKGDFVLDNAQRCFPLTVLDDCSRYSLCIQARPDQQLAGVKAAFTALFETYGLPDAILCDNGPPWGCQYQSGYTAFEVWLMKLAILPIHGRPRHPQTQGKEERFHRTLKAEALRGSLSDMAQAQARFDAFRREYNSVRPHEALLMDVPANRYRPSLRPFPQTLPAQEIPLGAQTRKIGKNGYLLFGSQSYYLSEALRGETVALVDRHEGYKDVEFYGFRIARVDMEKRILLCRSVFRML